MFILNSIDLASALKNNPDDHVFFISIVGGPTEEELKKQGELEFFIGMGRCLVYDATRLIFSFGDDTLRRLSIDKSRLDICRLQKQGGLYLFGRDCLTSEFMLDLSCFDSPYDLTGYPIYVTYNCINKSGILTLIPASVQQSFTF